MEMFWENGNLSEAFITSKVGGECKLLTKKKVSVPGVENVKHGVRGVGEQSFAVTAFNTVAGKKYEVMIK